MAAKTANLNVRMDPELKEEVQSILNTLGISTTEAVRAYFKQIKLHQGIPFELRIPNELTQETLHQLRDSKEVDRFDSTEDLFDDLGV